MEKNTLVPDAILYEFINKSGSPKNISMFGYNKGPLGGDPDLDWFCGIGMKTDNANRQKYYELCELYKNKVTDLTHERKLRVYGIQLIVSERPQLQNRIEIHRDYKTGKEKNIFQPLNYQSAQSTITSGVLILIDKVLSEQLVNPLFLTDDVYIETLLNPNTHAEYRFILKEHLFEELKAIYKIK